MNIKIVFFILFSFTFLSCQESVCSEGAARLLEKACGENNTFSIKQRCSNNEWIDNGECFDPSKSPMNRINYQKKNLFLSGANVAWLNYASDVGNFSVDELRFTEMFDNVSSAGGNVMRLWIHTNGSETPIYEDGKIIGIHEKTIIGLLKLLDIAYERGILLNLCLWSFDMLRPQNGVDINANLKLLIDEEHTNSYIDNALTPLVRELKDHPGIAAWEIFNEPEGMSHSYGWTETRISMRNIQKFINLTAGAIHRESPDAQVTNGSWSFKASCDAHGHYNYYTDERLKKAGGDPLGTLDFYEVHFYGWADKKLSPFHHPASYWQLDKPLVISEFLVEDTLGIEQETLYSYLYENGYAGAIGWQYNEAWDDIKIGIESISDREDILFD